MRRGIRGRDALGSFFRGSGRRGQWLGSFTQPAWRVVQLIVRIEMVLVTQATHNSTLPHYPWLPLVTVPRSLAPRCGSWPDGRCSVQVTNVPSNEVRRAEKPATG